MLSVEDPMCYCRAKDENGLVVVGGSLQRRTGKSTNILDSEAKIYAYNITL